MARGREARRKLLRNILLSTALEIYVISILIQCSNLQFVHASPNLSLSHAISVGIRSAIAPYNKSCGSSNQKSTCIHLQNPLYTSTCNDASFFTNENRRNNDYFAIKNVNEYRRRSSQTTLRRGRSTDEGDHDSKAIVNCSTKLGSSVSCPPKQTRDTDTNNHTSKVSDKVQTETSQSQTLARGGGDRKLVFWENMVCGAISRSVAQILTHPANTMKTLLQSNRNGAKMTLNTLARPKNLKMLTRGAGAQFVMSVPHGAINFAVLEYVRKTFSSMAARSAWAREKQKTNKAFNPAMDFVSSSISTICCSVVSTPQMMILDNIMAGTYPNLVSAVTGLSREKGIMGFYSGWWPGLAGKIPSYALTWTLFQEIKEAQLRLFKRQPTDIENSIMGCMASTVSVCIMIPMDTIKTRLVTQMNYPDLVPYKGIIDCAVRITKEEGIGTFYRGLPPRLVSVVPMIGIQFGVYEFMKKVMLSRQIESEKNIRMSQRKESPKQTLEEVMLEVAADDDQPFPVPHFDDRMAGAKNGSRHRSMRSHKKKVRG